MCVRTMRSLLIGVAVFLGIVLGGCSQMSAPTIEVTDSSVDQFAAVADAAFKGDLDSIKSSIESNPSYLDASDPGGRTLLHYAAEGGHEDVVAYLLENGAPVDVEDSHANSALDTAIMASAPTAVIDMLKDAM